MLFFITIINSVPSPGLLLRVNSAPIESKLFLTTITLIVIAYNSLFFLDKFYERRKESIKYDYLLSKSISSFILYNKEIKKNDLDKNGKKYVDQIMISVSNKIINIQ